MPTPDHAAAAPPATAHAGPAPSPSASGAPAAAVPASWGNGWLITAAVTGALAVVAITLALIGQQRIKSLEQELVRRQQESQGQAIEARAMAQQAQDLARAAETKVALLDGRVAETVLQRTQLEDLIQQLSRSRDENVLADVDAALRVAVQQSTITGSAEPLAAALRQAEDRLARMNQPRMERVRRALARDLDLLRAVAVTDIASLTTKLDEAIRAVDDLPLLAQPERRAAPLPRPGSATVRPTAAAPASAAAPAAASASDRSATPSEATGSWLAWLQAQGAWLGGQVWDEVRGLVRVSRIDKPEAMLVSPEQGWFLRENLKLRLLNARLALMSRQFDTAQSDLRDALGALDRYFDRRGPRVLATADLLRQVTSQARKASLPRPDETLAALAAAQAGR